MNALLTTNIYEPQGVLMIAGACLPKMQPDAFKSLASQADCILSLCLEESHINMAVTKLGAMLSTDRITKVIFATVDRSPHCTQLHYIDHELKRMMPSLPPFEHYVAADGKLFPVSDQAIEQSKTLRTLTQSI
ncbi:MAG: hypothetical protein IKW00_00210 [Clostridia bacterium]|nr:hypothetical protein [Clostridia bacterium]